MSFQVQMTRTKLTFAALALSSIAGTVNAQAAGDPRGVWYDHNGRGAVEIKNCSGNANRLCGHVVYVKKARNKKRCGMQIIGNVRSNGRGWIYSPKRGRSYPLAMKRLSDNRLRIVGNAGSFFTKTYIWKRAPEGIANCGQEQIAKKPAQENTKPTKTVAKTTAKTVTKKVAKSEPQARQAPKKVATPEIEPGTASSATSALYVTAATAAQEPEPAPEAVEPEVAETTNDNGDDLTPPGGLSDGSDDKLEKLNTIIKKYTGGKGLKGIKLSSRKGGKTCKYRIPYVGRTINVPCK